MDGYYPDYEPAVNAELDAADREIARLSCELEVAREEIAHLTEEVETLHWELSSMDGGALDV